MRVKVGNLFNVGDLLTLAEERKIPANFLARRIQSKQCRVFRYHQGHVQT